MLTFRWIVEYLCYIALSGPTLIIAGCNRANPARSDSNLAGIWRFEDERNIEELALSPGSFKLVTTNKQQNLATPGRARLGIWQRNGNELTFTPTPIFEQPGAVFKRTVTAVTKDNLMMRSSGEGKSITYVRITLPECNGSLVNMANPVRENDLLGLWQIHYNTHDYRFRFMPNQRAELLGLSNNKWDLLSKGNWHVDGNRLICRPEGASHDTEDSRSLAWIIMETGEGCFTLSDGWSPYYALRRVTNSP